MKRLLIRLGLVSLVALGYVVATESSAWACHWKDQVGENCPGEPEDQPFDPVLDITVDDDLTEAHPDLTVKFTQVAHEQFVVKLVSDAPAESDIDLDAPNLDEQIGTLDLNVVIQGVETPLDGELFDRNDGVNWPNGGVYKWDLLVHGVNEDFHIDVFVDENAPDGHAHLEGTVGQDLQDAAEMVNASVLEFTLVIDGETNGGDPFVTNPSEGGDYDFTVEFTPRDEAGNNVPPDPPLTKTDTITIEDRVPDVVVVTPANQTKRVGEDATLTAEVTDQGGALLAGALVDFSVSGANPGLKCDDVATGADGKASCTYSGNSGGTDTVTATATKHGVSESGTAEVKWREPTTIDLTPAAATKRKGTSHTLTATVKDQDGVAMQGETVTFTRTGANPGSASGTTNAAGQATHTYTGDNIGDDTVEAAVVVIAPDEITDTATAHWIEPTTLDLTPATAGLVEDQQHTLTATVKDQDGNPMAGETVTFSRAGANPGSGTGTTNAAGQATHTYTGTNPGDDTVTASVSGTPASDTATVHWDAAVATTLTLTPETAERSTGQSYTATAEVRDQIERPLSGVSVHFEVTGANPQSADETTDAGGHAELTYTGQNAGTDTVTATVAALSDTATVEWNALIPTTLETTLTHDHVVAGQQVSYAFPQHHTATATAAVKDQNGDLMDHIAVRFEITSGPNATGQFDQTVLTGADGKATWSYSGRIANGEGTDNVRIRVVNTDLERNHSMTWRWHPCDNPDAVSLGLPIEGGMDQQYTVQGQTVRVVVCWNKPHQHTN